MDAKKSYWFKRRRYGYGWMPITWQGWLVVVGYLVVVLGSASLAARVPEDQLPGLFLLLVVAATAVLFAICLTKGPRPRWRWGKKPGDNPDEDF